MQQAPADPTDDEVLNGQAALQAAATIRTPDEFAAYLERASD